jgi:hypothetical protein
MPRAGKPKLLDPVRDVMRITGPVEELSIASGDLTFVTVLTL